MSSSPDRRRPVRRAVAVAGLAVAATAGVPLPGASAAGVNAAGVNDAATGAPRVVVVAVPDLLWSDLTPSATPAMWRLLGAGASGVLSVKSEWQLAGCADGLLTLGAGDRLAAERSSAAARPCTGTTPSQLTPDRVDPRNGFGRLAATLRAHGIRTAAYGDGAELALPGADVTGPLGPNLTAADAQVVLAVDDAVYVAPPAARASAVHAVDAQLASLLTPLPSTTTVLLVGSSDRPAAAGPGPGQGPAEAHLHVAIARGPGFPPGSLRSSSTKRAPYVELIDVAPTVLDLVGAPPPTAMVGRAWERSAGPADPAARAATLRDLDVKAVQGAHWRPAFMWTLALLALVVALVGVVVRQRISAGRRLRAGSAYAALLVSALPIASWLVQLGPWWRWDALVLPLLLVLIAAAVAGAAVIAANAGRRDPARALLVVTGVSAGVLVVDLVTGSRLQTSALLGDSPITAGRFYGAGNTAFGVLAGAALLGTAVAVGRRPGPQPPAATTRWRRAALAGLVLAVVGLVDAAPSLGADLGGAAAFFPSALVLVLLLAGVRPTWRRALGAAAAGLLPVVALAVWDYHRPAARRTHIGDFVAQLVHGQAGSVLRRKLAANVGQLGSSPFLPLVLGALVAVAVVVVQARRGRPSPLAGFADGPPGLRPGLVALVLCAVLGAVLNDSGVTVTGIMLSVALPALTALALQTDRAAPTDHAERADPVNTG